MTFALASEVSGTELVVHDTIGSTSVDAMERLRAGAASPFWVVSDHQTAGRGRRGSAWATPAGNLAASFAMRLDLPPPTIATLGFVAGVAVVAALRDVARRQPQGEADTQRWQLKWPNDVLAGSAKLVGILLETEETRQGRAVVVGIGVNVRHAPEGLAYETASLAGLGLAVSAESLFWALSGAWADALRVWDEGRGFAAIRSAWLDGAAGLGGPVTVRLGGATVAGTFETIDHLGQLVVRLPDGKARTISAGDVHFGNAASLRAEAVA